MVFFCCNGCGDSVKKQSVEKHQMQCRRSGSFDCLDCHKTFQHPSKDVYINQVSRGNEYKAHTSCVSEASKYGGKDYEPKVNKGQVKQEGWIDQVHSSIESCPPNNIQLRELFSKLQQYTNIPRKQKPFINFLINSCNLKRNPELAQRAWDHIAAQTKTSTAAAQNGTSVGGSEPAATDTTSATPSSSLKRAATSAANGDTSHRESDRDNDASVQKRAKTDTSISTTAPSSSSSSRFKWKSTLKRLLKTAPNQTLRLKKLRARAIKEYRRTLGDADGDDKVVMDDSELWAVIDNKLSGMANVHIVGKQVQWMA